MSRKIQLKRQGCCNAQLGNNLLDRYCELADGERMLLERAAERLKLSPRAIHRIMKVARTLADLDAKNSIASTHLAEAIAYRSPVKGWQASL